MSQDATVAEEISAQHSSTTATVDVAQESTTPDGGSTSQQDRLAGTGEVNNLIIGDFNSSTEFSQPGSRSSSVVMETQKFMSTVAEENTENVSSLSQDITSRIKEASKKSADAFSEESDSEIAEDIEDEDVQEEVEEIDIDQSESSFENEDGDKMLVADEVGDDDDYFDEIEELNNEEVVHMDEEERQHELSIKEELEQTQSEGKMSKSPDVKVLSRMQAPKVMLEYEPSTTEAESGLSDSDDTLETESLQEEFVTMVKGKKHRKHAGSQEHLAGHKSGVAIDTEVVRVMEESPSAGSRPLAASQDDFQRGGSSEPTTQDTLGDGDSLNEEAEVTVVTLCDLHLQHQLDTSLTCSDVIPCSVINYSSPYHLPQLDFQCLPCVVI